jgi:hypothetical protein
MNGPLDNIDERIRAALHAAADGVHEHDLRPADPPAEVTNRPRVVRWAAPLLAAAAVIGIVATTIALSTSPQGQGTNQPGTSQSATFAPSLPVSTSATTSPSTSRSHSKSSSPSHTTQSSKNHHSHSSAHSVPPVGQTNCYLDVPCQGSAQTAAYEPLWPFSSYAQAHQWQTVDRPAGHDPGHLDAQQTALSFVQGYLGFTDITKVTSAQIGDNDAQIGVGYDLPSGGAHTAATLHLVKYSITTGYPIAPWEVVSGTTTDFAIDSPSNASDVASPLTVSGTITGTDENITVSVRSLDGGVFTGTPVPAGGDQQPWSADVSFQASGPVTLVASTGGHVTEHERFVVTGVSAT